MITVRVGGEEVHGWRKYAYAALSIVAVSIIAAAFALIVLGPLASMYFVLTQ